MHVMNDLPAASAAPAAAELAGVVSVIVIFLNEARHLRAAVESVIAQEGAEWELLLVDDGSTDGSSEIARGYAQADPRIRYLAHPRGENRGMSASRNLGLAHARGEYVAFLDGDDLYLPERLQRHVAILSANPHIAMVVSDHLRWLSDHPGAARPADAVYARGSFALGDQVWQPPLGLMVTMGVPYLALGICNVTVRRCIALEVGGFEAEFRGLFEDQVFTSKILARYPSYVLQAYLARYRHHSSSLTRQTVEQRTAGAARSAAETERFVAWLRAHLEATDITDSLLLQLVERRAGRRASGGGVLEPLLTGALASAKQCLQRVLPPAWHLRLLRLDYALDRWQARRRYDRLARALGRRALARALARDARCD